MLRVEQRFLNAQRPKRAKCKDLAFQSNNIYNLINYYVKQYLFITGYVLGESEIYHRHLQPNELVENCLHRATIYIIDRRVGEVLGTFVRHSPLRERLEIKNGSAHLQNFTSIYRNSIWAAPLIYKAIFFRGIKVVESLEFYRSKCSLIEGGFKEKGHRAKPGLFNAAKKQLIDEHFKGAFNIIRTVCENKAFSAFDFLVAVQLQPGKVNPLRERYFTNKKLRDTCFYLALPSFFVAA